MEADVPQQHEVMRGQAVDESFADNRGRLRERELELEIARLNAEIETLRGDHQPTDVAARFLAMAASTVDQAMEEARRDVAELAAEASADAEARRDEAKRSADEAELRALTLRAEAEQTEMMVNQARAEANGILAVAEREAAGLVAAERSRVADELEVLSGVRVALEEEREALESYHDELKRRVQELAESMVAFMTTEPPLGTIESAALDAMSQTGPMRFAETVAPTAASATGDERNDESRPAEPLAFVDYVVETDPETGDAPDREPPPSLAETTTPPPAGLFGRATEQERNSSSGLFGAHGQRLLEQTSPEQLAAALASEDDEDERFRSFINGDDGSDPSREWLLRPEQR